jgi:hypothetical protein
MVQILALVADHGPLLGVVALLLAGAFIFSASDLAGMGNENIPLIGHDIGNTEKRRQAFISNAQNLYSKGYERFRDSVWRLTGTDGTSR